MSASDVWAVGYYQDTSAGTYQTLIEHWNGTAWSVIASPNAARPAMLRSTRRVRVMLAILRLAAAERFAVSRPSPGRGLEVSHPPGYSARASAVANISQVRVLRATMRPDLSTQSFSDCSVMACAASAASSTTRSA